MLKRRSRDNRSKFGKHIRMLPLHIGNNIRIRHQTADISRCKDQMKNIITERAFDSLEVATHHLKLSFHSVNVHGGGGNSLTGFWWGMPHQNPVAALQGVVIGRIG